MRFEDLEKALMIYVNTEMISKINDWKKWAMPLALKVVSPSLKNGFEKLLPTIGKSGIVKETGDIDVDYLFSELLKISKEAGDILWDIPYMGTMKFSTDDVNSLYSIIRSMPEYRASSVQVQPTPIPPSTHMVS